MVPHLVKTINDLAELSDGRPISLLFAHSGETMYAIVDGIVYAIGLPYGECTLADLKEVRPDT